MMDCLEMVTTHSEQVVCRAMGCQKTLSLTGRLELTDRTFLLD